jgi:hypothetical protein
MAAGTALASSPIVLSSKRAVRYGLRLPVLYRAAGEHRWRAGTTMNLSASGVLISGELPADADGPISVVIPLPSAQGCLTGCGCVARVPDLSSAPHGTFAITVPQFSIERQSDVLARAEWLHREC